MSSWMTASVAACRPLSNAMAVRTRTVSPPSMVAPACAGPSAAAIELLSRARLARCSRKDFSSSGVIFGSEATTSGAASSASISRRPLSTVTNGIALSTRAAGRSNTSQSSSTLAKGAPRGKWLTPAAR